MPDNAYRSGPHRRVEKALVKMGVSFFSESEEFPPYRLDLYLPKYHVGIEVDGPTHHAKYDRVRDTWLLERYFLPVLHIKAKGAWSSQAKLEKEIETFIAEHENSYEERKSKWLSMLTNAG